MKRIVIDGRMYSAQNAGIGRYSQNLLKNLAKLDHENEYFVILDQSGLKEWQISNKNFHPIKSDFVRFSFGEQTGLIKQIKSLKPDLVHFFNFNHPLLYNAPFVVTIHDLILDFYPSGRAGKSKLRKLAYKQTMRHAVKASQKIIVPSKATATDLIKYYQAEKSKIEVTYEASDDKKIVLPTPVEQEKTLSKYKITKPFFLFVSQWRPHKGLPELIKAYEIICQKHNNIQLVLTGGGKQDFQNIIELVERAKKTLPIVTTGFIEDEDLAVLYNHATALVFPSHYEGFGLPPIEAASLKLPTIATNTSSLPEVLGDAGIYFKSGDEKELAQKMEQILTETGLRSKMSEKVMLRAKQFSWRKTAQETLNVYQKIL